MHLPVRLKPTALTLAAAAALGSLAFTTTVAEPAPVLTLGETITVTGAAPADAAPAACDASAAPAITCGNLRSAIAHANGNANGTTKYDLIKLDNGSVHTLSVARDAGEAIDALDASRGDLDITEPVHIETANLAGERATIQGDEGFNDRLLQINAAVRLDNLVLTKGQGKFMNGGAIYGGDAANTTIHNSIVTDNYASWDQVDGTGELQGSGGGIYSKGPLTITKSTLSKNTAKTLRAGDGAKIGNGGAIYASQATTIIDSTIGGAEAGNVAVNGGGIQMAGGNKLEVLRTTISHNDAVSGGGINVVSPSAAPFTITNSTISSNHVTDSGAGINTNSAVTITNSTIALNRKDSGNKGSGLNLVGETVAVLKNTLLVDNTGGTEGGAASPAANCGKTGTGSPAITSSGGNLSTDDTCLLIQASDQQNVAVDAVKLGALALNGNTYSGTFTHAIAVDSLARDKAIAEASVEVDQRNVARLVTLDVGAFELPVADVRLTVAQNSVTVEPNQNATVTVTVANSGPYEATNVVVTGTISSIANLTVVSVPASCVQAGAVITCTIASLASGASQPLALTVRATAEASYTVTGSVTSDVADPVTSNNTITATVTFDEQGGGGGGCTTNPDAKFDGGLLGLLAAAFAGLALRRRRKA